ncbi:MAG TPA: thiamine pyrophosphate-requiring protein [Gammaproteobacteria bacterium]
MNVGQVIAEVMKREGVDILFTYPLNPLTEFAAAIDIRPLVVRQERVGCAMADAVGRTTSGDKVSVFCCQHGPGIENAFGSIAQAYSEGVPLVVVAGGAPRERHYMKPYFSSSLNFKHVTKQAETVMAPDMLVPALRRAFNIARNGRPGPTLVEIPADLWNAEVPGEIEYRATRRALSAPDAQSVDAAAEALLAARLPLIYAGQGVHYAKAWPELKELAELLEAPVTTSLEGKSAFPENHVLSLGSGGRTMPRAVAMHVEEADLVFGIGASFTPTSYGIRFPTKGKVFVHNTVDATDVDKAIPAEHALVGDSKLTLAMLLDSLNDRLRGRPRGRQREVVARIRSQKDPWLAEWRPHLTSEAKPLSPYRIINELLQVADVPNTIITHDAGSPRDELSPFWNPIAPLSYIGWGKSTQLGYGLGLTMGAKIAHPDKLCVNFWGDAAIGMTGMDFETCVRAKIPILSILSNNFAMATEDDDMVLSRQKYGSTDISGNYSEFAKAMGGYGERVTDPDQVLHALVRGIRMTQEGTPVLLEFITAREKTFSTG